LEICPFKPAVRDGGNLRRFARIIAASARQRGSVEYRIDQNGAVY
jgi:hypothetical protein